MIAGPTTAIPTLRSSPVRPDDSVSLREMRVGYFEDDDAPATAETCRAIQRSAQVLRDAGFVVEPFRPEARRARQLWRVLFVDGAAMLLRQAYRHREADMYSVVREIIEASNDDPPLTAELF
jgi:amidase